MLLWKHYGNKHQQEKMGGQGKGSPALKGVGGYRPTINWREISIRRKNVADRQVLACIVFSGVFIIVVGIIITVLGFLVISSQCPFMWEEGSGSCFYYARHNATWHNGKAYCQSQSATLLDLHSPAETDAILKMMLGRSWLGLRRGRGQQEWAWLTGAKLNYTRWQDPASSTASGAAALCAAMDESGAWQVLPCDGDDQAYVICDFIPGYNPFVLVGPVVIFCGVVVLILSIEVCIRRREFMEKNPEVMIADEDDDQQVDAGLINYGYGHFSSDDTTNTVTWPQVDASSPTRSRQVPSSSGIQTVVSPKESPDGGNGPRVHVVPASLPASPPLAGPVPEENSHSQEQLELLLSPKTLE